MFYFSEVDDYKTYAGKEDDFHFIYNANTGGGQSFLGGKFRDKNGNLASATALNGRIAVFRFQFGALGSRHDVMLADDATAYEIKPRAEGDSNMKLGVEGKPTPSSAIAAFLMLPGPCGVKRSADVNTSVLNSNNYWLQSMWLGVDIGIEGKAIFTPKDCIICGGVDKQGQGAARYFSIDFNQRLSDIIQLADNNVLEGDVLSCIKHFADIYNGNKPFVYEESSAVIKAIMKYLSTKYPEQYSGTLDPLAFIQRMAHNHKFIGPKKDAPHQLITYGAPGTGKSWRTEEETKGHTQYRTTFHPDSDYSTFVGAYKPTMKRVQRVNCIDDKAKAVHDASGNPSMQEVIAYDFVPQAFVKAYVDAWRKMDAAQSGGGAAEPVFLVIEEINRGNCAQIFGDLFQLLDRKEDGCSNYPIDADDDLKRFLADERRLGNCNAIPGEVRDGSKLILPPNLYIRATMNTSDQSLFPMDSAFKRRWEWKYVPIAKPTQAGWKDRVIVANGKAYDWWEFLEKANKQVLETTKSADKQMGYFFVKAPDATGRIAAERFTSKVLFYLYNDVFKDYDHPAALFGDGANGTAKYEFKDFFDEQGETKEDVVAAFLEQLGLTGALLSGEPTDATEPAAAE